MLHPDTLPCPAPDDTAEMAPAPVTLPEWPPEPPTDPEFDVDMFALCDDDTEPPPALL